MLAGTVYFYDDKEELIEEIDLEEYDNLSEDVFAQMISDLNAFRVVLNAVYHNHHNGTETVLYEKTGSRDNDAE